jgi:chemotaxis response regulator CheB
MKVLLVEDSLTVRTYIEGILRASPDITVLPAGARWSHRSRIGAIA